MVFTALIEYVWCRMKDELVHYSVAVVAETLAHIRGVCVMAETTACAEDSALLD